jgi:hypothetical protein
MMMDKLGIKFGVVQTGGTSQRFASLKGGHTQMAFMSPGWIKRGGDELRGLLWLGAERMPGVDMPTAKEKGLDVDACLKRHFWTPAGTPCEAVDYFAGVLAKVMQTPVLVAWGSYSLPPPMLEPVGPAAFPRWTGLALIGLAALWQPSATSRCSTTCRCPSRGG